MRKHYLIFIHGIGERETDQTKRQAIDAGFLKLWRNTADKYESMSGEQFDSRFVPIYVNWHTGVLHQAQATLYNTAFPELTGFQVSLIGFLRFFTTFYLGDVISYLSEDFNLIRHTVWSKIWAELEQPLKEEGVTYSIIAHSLGSVVAFDYLYSLFYKSKLFIPDGSCVCKSRDDLKFYSHLDQQEIFLLQRRFCHFFTLGSPIGLFMLREGSLVMRSNPFRSLVNPVLGMRRVWLNFYDQKDLVAYPLANLFKLNPSNFAACLPQDILVNSGFTAFDSHMNYWQNEELAETIAQVIRKD